MAYIGNTQQNQNYVPAVDYFNGDGSTVAFTLSRPVASVAQVQAVIENVPQNPGSAYTVSGNTLTFTSAPPLGTGNIYVYYTSPITQVATLSQDPVITGSMTFGTIGARIKGDFSNATVANRVAFQSSTTNGNTGVFLLPNGTAVSAAIRCFNNSDPTNASYIGFDTVGNTDTRITTSITGTGTYLPMTFYTGGSERMRIDTSGNVGIGTANPNTKLVVGSIATGTLDSTYKGNIKIEGTETTLESQGGLEFKMTSDGYGAKIQTLSSGGTNLIFANRNASATWTERMRISPSGNVGIGITNPTSPLHVSGTANITGNGYFGGQLNAANSGSTFDYGINLNAAGTGYIAGTNQDNATSTDTNVKIASWFGLGFASAISGQAVPYGQNAGWINCRTGAMQIRGALTQNASDRRLKENLEVIPNALEKIASISGYTFDWKMDKCFDLGFKPAKEHEHGVIAQEIKEVIPDAVSLAPFDTGGENEGTSFSRSGEEYLTVHIEKLIPLLLQGIKEQQAIIEDLKARIETLEAK